MPTHRFNWKAFRAFLETVIGQSCLTTDKQEYVAISLPTTKQMNSELAKRLTNSKTSFYLSHPVESFTIVGEGALERVSISGNKRFRVNIYSTEFIIFTLLINPIPFNYWVGFPFLIL